MTLKLTKQQGHVVFIVLVALGMSFLMGVGNSIVDGGLKTLFSGTWMGRWLVSFLIAIPCAWIVVPFMRRFTDRITRPS